jgi:hypothetical protein
MITGQRRKAGRGEVPRSEGPVNRRAHAAGDSEAPAGPENEHEHDQEQEDEKD